MLAQPRLEPARAKGRCSRRPAGRYIGTAAPRRLQMRHTVLTSVDRTPRDQRFPPRLRTDGFKRTTPDDATALRRIGQQTLGAAYAKSVGVDHNTGSASTLSVCSHTIQMSPRRSSAEARVRRSKQSSTCTASGPPGSRSCQATGVAPYPQDGWPELSMATSPEHSPAAAPFHTRSDRQRRFGQLDLATVPGGLAE